jgi:predicted site-specific integrase-resolvase
LDNGKARRDEFMNLLTTKETASLVHRPESTLRRWRSAGKGPPCYKLEGQWAYVEEEVIEWVRANRITFSVRDEHFEREAARVSL